MSVTDGSERSLALTYAPEAARKTLALLWSLDERLGDAVRRVHEPLLAEVKLTWWRDALSGLDDNNAQRDPLLLALSGTGLASEHLSAMADGWADALPPFPIDDDLLENFASSRGSSLFMAAGRCLGSDFAGLAPAGAGWALVDLAGWCQDAETARRALELALPRLRAAYTARWPKAARPIGMLGALALRDAGAGHVARRSGSPARQLRMLRHWFTGR